MFQNLRYLKHFFLQKQCSSNSLSLRAVTLVNSIVTLHIPMFLRNEALHTCGLLYHGAISSFLRRRKDFGKRKDAKPHDS